MFSARIKSIAILLLSVLAILQTTELWFENFSSRNFFYTFLPQIFHSAQIDYTGLYKNLFSRTMVNLGGSLAVSFSSTDESDRAILNVLSRGNFVAAGEVNWQEILKARSIIYEYSAQIPSTALVKSYGLSSSAVTSRVKNISYIILIPNRTNDEQLRVIFIDELVGQSYEYTIAGQDLNEPLQTQLRAEQSNIDTFFYISSSQNGFETFKRNTFIPKWTDSIYGYNAVIPYNPYSENGDDPLLYTVEKKIDTFFDNPILKDTRKINGVYTYSTETLLVRYRPSSVLEYYSYRPVSKNASVDFFSEFAEAFNFLKRDGTILNDVYLSYTEESGGARTFYFDYSINNFPIFLSDSLKEQTGLEHAIEITVENGEVKQYKRYVAAFYTEEDVEINATVDFLNVINNTLEGYGDDVETYIEDLVLGYRMEKDRAMILYWLLDINGNNYIKGAQ